MYKLTKESLVGDPELSELAKEWLGSFESVTVRENLAMKMKRAVNNDGEKGRLTPAKECLKTDSVENLNKIGQNMPKKDIKDWQNAAKLFLKHNMVDSDSNSEDNENPLVYEEKRMRKEEDDNAELNIIAAGNISPPSKRHRSKFYLVKRDTDNRNSSDAN